METVPSLGVRHRGHSCRSIKQVWTDSIVRGCTCAYYREALMFASPASKVSVDTIGQSTRTGGSGVIAPS